MLSLAASLAKRLPCFACCVCVRPCVGQALKARFSSLREFKFPPKKWFSRFTSSTIQIRRENFEIYLRELV